MNFQVNGQDYFLAFVESENRWFVFAPSQEGVQKFPVYVDAVKWERGIGLEATRELSS